jgi:hypothetical protein
MSNYKKLILVLILAWTFMIGLTCGFILDSLCEVRKAGAEEVTHGRIGNGLDIDVPLTLPEQGVRLTAIEEVENV